VVLTSTDRDVMSALPAGDPARELPFVPKVDLPGAPLRRMLGAD
jgi:hypothetical protein